MLCLTDSAPSRPMENGSITPTILDLATIGRCKLQPTAILSLRNDANGIH